MLNEKEMELAVMIMVMIMRISRHIICNQNLTRFVAAGIVSVTIMPLSFQIIFKPAVKWTNQGILV